MNNEITVGSRVRIVSVDPYDTLIGIKVGMDGSVTRIISDGPEDDCPIYRAQFDAIPNPDPDLINVYEDGVSMWAPQVVAIEAQPVEASDVGAIVRELCDMEPFDPDHADAVCVNVHDLIRVLEAALAHPRPTDAAPTVEQAGEVVTHAMIVAANHAHADYEVAHFKRKRSVIEFHEHTKAAMKVALEAALAAQPRPVGVPETVTIDDARARGYQDHARGWVAGWNDCRFAVLAAAPDAEMQP